MLIEWWRMAFPAAGLLWVWWLIVQLRIEQTALRMRCGRLEWTLLHFVQALHDRVTWDAVLDEGRMSRPASPDPEAVRRVRAEIDNFIDGALTSQFSDRLR